MKTRPRLRGELDKIGSVGAFGHPNDVEQRGKVPDFPEWSYFFHGSGCCLTHVDGTEIDVDFTKDGQSTRIDPYFYSNYLESLKNPELPEQLLKKPDCLRNYWQVDLPELQKLECWDDRQVTDLGVRVHEILTPVIERLSDLANRSDENAVHKTLYLLLHLGDYVQASRVALRHSLLHPVIPEIQSRASTANTTRKNLLIDATSQPSGRYGIPLQALAELGPKLAKDTVA